MPLAMSVRVAVVDDSPIARAAMSNAIARAQGIALLGAYESVRALEHSGMLKEAQVILLDMWMPERSGLSAVRELAANARVVVVSDAPDDSSIAKEARAQGASAFFSKRAIGSSEGREALFAMIRGLAPGGSPGEVFPVLVLVGSTGAPRAVDQIMPSLVGVRAAIIIAQHAPLGGEREIARFVTTLGLAATVARAGEALEPGKVFVAPGGKHLRLTPKSTFRVDPAQEKEVAPNADLLLDSMAWLERRLVVVVLSGMGRDGARGVAAVARAGGLCLVQDPADCVADSMPKSALAATKSACAIRLPHLGAHARTFLHRAR
jgi:two-component system chemotaxis response regulator CheB